MYRGEHTGVIGSGDGPAIPERDQLVEYPSDLIAYGGEPPETCWILPASLFPIPDRPHPFSTLASYSIQKSSAGFRAEQASYLHIEWVSQAFLSFEGS